MSEKIMTDQDRMNYWWRKAKAAEEKLEKVEKILIEDGVSNDPSETKLDPWEMREIRFIEQGNWDLAEKIRKAIEI
jgi:hypothetical protein